jgi:hypothetical protein
VGGGGRHKQEGTTEHAPCKERGDGSHRGGAAPSRWRSSDAQWLFGGDEASLRPTVMQLGCWGPEREREHDEVRPFWLGEGEQRSSPKRWGGGGFSAISGEGQWNPMPGSGHLAAKE